MGYLVSWTYGPGYVEALLDILSVILLSDVVAIVLITWTCWKSRRAPQYDSVTEISTTEKHEESESNIVTISAKDVAQPVESFEVEVQKSEASTQTKVKELKDQQTDTEQVKESVSVQTIDEHIGKDDATQTSDQEDDEIDSNVVQPVDVIDEKPETTETSTQTKEIETRNQETIIKEEKESVSVQTVEEIGKDGETQTDPDDTSDDSSKDSGLVRQISRDHITFTSGWRREVKLTELIKARLILETRVQELERKEITEEEVEKELEPFLIGRYPIAGVLISKSMEKMSLNEAYGKGIITRGTAVSLLEAQAAVGSIIDPRNGEKMSVAKAKEVGLIDKKMAGIIVRAEKAVTGFRARATNETISLFQAMKRNLVVESHGIRLLEAQIATGGIIDPVAHIRLPVEVAFERGLFDEHLHRILEDPSDDTKGFLDPNTGENLTYLELLQRCVQDEDTGLLLLPLIPEEERQGYLERYANTSYCVSPTHSNRTFSIGSETPSLDESRDAK